MITRREFIFGSASAGLLLASGAYSWGSASEKFSLLWDPEHHLHNLKGHPESAQRLEAVHDFLIKQKLWSNVIDIKKIDEKILLLGHTKEYIERVRASKDSYIDNDKWSSYSTRDTFNVAARASTGLAQFALAVARGEKNRGFALLRPPGHHATANKAEGFCVFNHVALSALHTVAETKMRVAIVDLDAHHGNGIQDMIENSDKILYISTHQKDWFPYTGKIDETGKKKNLMNLPVALHTGDKAYAEIMQQLILPKLKGFKPDLLFVCAGYDAHWRDYMAELGLSLKAYQNLHRELIQFAEENCGGKIIFSLEGGYNLEALSQGVANTVALLAGQNGFWDTLGPSPLAEPDLTKMIAQAKKIHNG